MKGRKGPRPNAVRNWQLFRAVVVDGLSYAAAGRIFGLSQQRAEYIVKRCRKMPEAPHYARPDTQEALSL